MKLEVGKTYVFKDESCRWGYFNKYKGNRDRYNKVYRGGYTLDHVSGGGLRGDVEGLITICSDELGYFKLKEENKMLKPDDKISIEMTALDGMYLKNILGKIPCTFSEDVHLTLERVLRNSDPFYDDNLIKFDLSYEDEFKEWCIAQFKDPKQAEIDQLEKTINDAAAKLARLKGNNL